MAQAKGFAATNRKFFGKLALEAIRNDVAEHHEAGRGEKLQMSRGTNMGEQAPQANLRRFI